MSASQSVPELVAEAQAKAKTFADRISEIQELEEGSKVEDLRATTKELELIAVDIYSVFEARMQHTFKRGPFSRKLKALLLEAGKADLANRIHLYYLAINVLKHGTGASYRELLETPSSGFVVRPSADIKGDENPEGLVDVTVAGFFDGLAATILEAFAFLDNRAASKV